MKTGIHQPNFLPWLGYFYKIYKSDQFVLIDNVQFVKGSVCNRAKIKNNQGAEIWLTVPVKGNKGSQVNYNELELDYSQKWAVKMINQLHAAYVKAPYFDRYFQPLSDLLKQEYKTLADLNITLIKYLCSELNIQTPMAIASELDTDFGKKNDLNLNICKYFKSDVYLSGTGAKKYNDEELFKTNGITIEYSDFVHPVYPQQFGAFIPGLSTIDLLFNCGPESMNYLTSGQQ